MRPLRLLRFFFFLSVFVACKKEKTGGGDTPLPSAVQSQKVKRDHGQPLGAAVSKIVGAAGGSIQSADGRLTVTVPSGAVESATQFSIQPVTNTLETRGLSYRLLPEGLLFKKDLTVTYSYAGIGLANPDSKYLFLTYQDAAGYYHEAVGTQNNMAAQTLSVKTAHFSDWTFFSRVELGVNWRLVNGVAHMTKNEEMNLDIHTYRTKKEANDAADTAGTVIEDFILNPNVDKAAWSLSKPRGTVTPTYLGYDADYRAPASIAQTEDLLVTVTLDGSFGTDNFGNPVKQLMLSQPVTLEPDDQEYFTASVDGAEQNLQSPAVLDGGGAIQLGGYWANGNALTIQLYGSGINSYGFGEPGAAGKATMQYTVVGDVGYISFRPENCTNSQHAVYSAGAVTVSKVAQQIGEYTEGTLNAELFYVDWCGNGKTKNISGRFKVRKKQ